MAAPRRRTTLRAARRRRSPATSRSSATCERSRSRSDCGLGDRLELDERAEPLDLVEVDADRLPQQQPPSLGDHDVDAVRRRERGEHALRVGHRHDAVARHPHLGGVRPLVGDQVGLARLLLAQLQAAVGDAEVGVALDDHAAILGAERERALERARRIGIERLQLHIAARLAHRVRGYSVRARDRRDRRRPSARGPPSERAARPRDAVGRVPPPHARGRDADRLRGAARPARRRDRRRDAARDDDGRAARRRHRRDRDPARRARHGRGFPRPDARGARRAPRHVPRRGQALAGRLLRVDPRPRPGGRDRARRPDARDRRQRGLRAAPAQGARRPAAALRLPRRRARGGRGGARASIPTCRSSAPRSTAGSTSAATSGPGLGDAGDRLYGTD